MKLTGRHFVYRFFQFINRLLTLPVFCFENFRKPIHL